MNTCKCEKKWLIRVINQESDLVSQYVDSQKKKKKKKEEKTQMS